MNNKNNAIVYLTRERIIELENELRLLKTEGRPEIARKIAEARSHGDLSENAEYKAAKETQEHLEIKIGKLEDTLSRVQRIESKELPNDKIYILSVVTLRNKTNNEKVVYTLVSPEEANFEENKISITSPIGQGLLGKKPGDEVKIKVPVGFLEYEILDITR